ncbi:hypothetical protein CMI47_14510 [Candidatus Pacearchaeota archaeon]|nr:hypothetical protein [Candidatus Pacearchaeota archaeon]
MAKPKDTTGTDIGTATIARDEIPQAEVDRFDLEPHLVKLMWDEPFYSKVLRGITKIRTDEIPTAGVLAKDGDVKMYWNPRFLTSLLLDGGEKKIKGLNIHECLHLVFGHTTTRKHEPHIVWNYSTDCAINSLIERDLLPDCGIIPGEAFTPLTAEQIEKMGVERVAKYQTMSDFIESLPLGLCSEEYFGLFMQNQEVKDILEEEGKRGQPGGPGGEGGEPSDLPGFDDHDGWGELTDDERAMVAGKIKEAVKNAASECDAKGSWGTVGAEARQKIRELVSTEIPWETLIKQFVGMSRRANRSTSRMRLNKKYPGVHSGFKRGYTASIAVYIDQSGSVSETELNLLFGCLRDLAKKTEFITYHFDTDVDEDSETTWRGGRTPETHRTRCGGTCFDAPTTHVNKNKSKFDGAIILTDGYAPQPKPSRIRRAWVITPQGDQDFKCGSETVIVMKDRSKKQAA